MGYKTKQSLRQALLAGCCWLAGWSGANGQLTEVRTINGVGNNLASPDFGSAGSILLRNSAAAYPGDGSGNTILSPPDAPSARTVSNGVIDQAGANIPNDHYMSALVWQWGQFIDHDISLTDTGSAFGTAPISVDNPFDPIGPAPLPMDRSAFDPATGTAGVPREHINVLTSYIDASQVYGSDATRAAALRTFSGGKMATSAGNLLPFNTTGLPNAGSTSSTLFLAGDVRVNEQVGLTAIHTLFVREHNRLTDLLAAQIPTASDEDLYQMARKIVGAEMQIITYNEFLPVLLGSAAPKATDFNYDNTINPGVATEFSTALFRVGHTMLSPELPLINADGTSAGAIGLRDAFFNPAFVANDPDNVDRLLNGLSKDMSQMVDNMIVDDVRNFLFGPPGAGGLDLAALNIQRGRDHGLPDYNTVRVAYGLPAVTSFDEITSNASLAIALEEVYGDINQIDPWVGALSEDHLPGASVGPLVAAGLIDQFTRLRDGDRFFYLNDSDLLHADLSAVIDLNSLSLQKVIQWNTSLSTMPDSVFTVPEPTGITSALLALAGLCWWRRAVASKHPRV